ncbi:S8 family serine peptidase [Streptomyces sp. NBC_00234]|uniref:S8 family serine peptidase n=1 Tax=Streptomyces sp. NBC_00234 TaxID=2903638 RepID=UPI002E287B35|nr:S8 family serine peptidase [Streptomyces sp. NBC_00234]
MRFRRRAALLSFTLATTMAGGGLAHGATPAPKTGEDAVTTPSRADVRTAKVTLVTGDQVTVATKAGKTLAVNVTPYQRSAAELRTYTVGTDVYVIPRDVEALVHNGQVDGRLFNVTQLIAQGFDDAHHASTPMIVRYAPTAEDSTPGGARLARKLPGLRGAAVSADKGKGATFWEAVDDDSARAGTPKARLSGGIQRLWLDGKVTALLDKSVPQIGAPEAWKDGFDGSGVKVAVLDTGVDDTHPDLADRIVESRSFVPGETARDGHGHGTHVASTILGSGAASGGKYRGVAPGAHLVVGKVLSDAGSGSESSIIEGMDWAAHSGAKVVSMSLGGAEGADGTDPMSMAVNELTARTGVLFTIAAGNSGPAATTVGSPGAADAALTVGAVDSTDAVTGFSSRGPRGGNGGLKPEITAPGARIVAARAAGTTMGTPVDGSYTTASGTSMATPHVAGAAAILAQRHPDWTPARLKSRLISTARTTAATSVYAQGAGRVDVARALRQPVSASGTADFGLRDWDATAPVERTIEYVNDGDQPVTLALKVENAGEELPAGVLGLGAESVTVPAHGTADVTLTLNTAGVTTGSHGAHVTAVSADGRTAAVTAVGFGRDVQRFDVTLKVLDRDGRPTSGIAAVTAWQLGRQALPETYPIAEDGTAVVRVPRGEHAFISEIFHYNSDWSLLKEYTYGTVPGTLIDSDRTVTLDGSEAGPVTMATSRPTETNRSRVGLAFQATANDLIHDRETWLEGETAVYSIPTKAANERVEARVGWSLGAPALDARLVGHGNRTLDAAYLKGWTGSARIDGTRVLRVAKPGEDVGGKLALVKRSAERTVGQQVDDAASAGAVAVIVYNDLPENWRAGNWSPTATKIPAMTLSGTQGEELAALDDARIRFSGTAVSPYTYELLKHRKGGIPADQRYRVRDTELAAVDSSFHASSPDTEGGYARLTRSPMQPTAYFGFDRVLMPHSRTEYVSADVPTWEAVKTGPVWTAGGSWKLTTPAALKAGQRVHREWNKAVVRTALPDAQLNSAVRQGTVGVVMSGGLLDTATGQSFSAEAGSDKALSTVYRDGLLLGSVASAPVAFPMTAERAEYRLVTDVQRDAPGWTTSTKVHTDWRFHSEQKEGMTPLPVLSVDYRLDVDRTNSARPHSTTRIGLGVRYPKGLNGLELTGAKLWASYDDGATWRQVRLDGGLKGTIDNPGKAGFVSLRVQASDADGNSVEQTVTRAYQIRR